MKNIALVLSMLLMSGASAQDQAPRENHTLEEKYAGLCELYLNMYDVYFKNKNNYTYEEALSSLEENRQTSTPTKLVIYVFQKQALYDAYHDQMRGFNGSDKRQKALEACLEEAKDAGEEKKSNKNS